MQIFQLLETLDIASDSDLFNSMVFVQFLLDTSFSWCFVHHTQSYLIGLECEYAVRGEIVLLAQRLQQDLLENPAIEKMAPKRCYSKEDLLEEFDLSMQMQRKRQKSSGLVASHQLEHFNDVTASAEIDLEEEQEQLFSKAAGNKVSTSSHDRQYSVHQEEEMFLSKTFLRAKLENNISKCSLKTVGKEVEDCLLLGLGEMMDRLIRNMIRMSKQRVDYEKKRHRILVTSDIHRHIMIMNRKCQDQKKLQDEKPNRDISDGEIDKSAKGSAATKSNKKKKEADLRLETAARTNKAVRASLGGDDFVSKWTLLSRKGQHEEEPEIGDQPDKKMNKGSKGTVQKNSRKRSIGHLWDVL